jgi:hypothetical protein
MKEMNHDRYGEGFAGAELWLQGWPGMPLRFLWLQELQLLIRRRAALPAVFPGVPSRHENLAS